MAPLAQGALLRWYAEHGRDLPWRGSGPWGVLVSEVMLQQTQVARVVPAWRAFVERFPAPPALAAATAGDAIVAWHGLGYNRRAVRLHAAAVAVTRDHAGAVPPDLAALRVLPGVGGYTARAVAAFAHDLPAAPVDTNVARVLSRAVAGTPLSAAGAQRLADACVVPGRPGDWGQALMDLGATVCTARTPRCDACPLRSGCAWRRDGGPDPAAGNAHRGRPQGVFEGSARQRRGRLVAALRNGPVDAAALRGLLGEHGPATAAGLVDDGLAVWEAQAIHLP